MIYAGLQWDEMTGRVHCTPHCQTCLYYVHVGVYTCIYMYTGTLCACVCARICVFCARVRVCVFCARVCMFCAHVCACVCFLCTCVFCAGGCVWFLCVCGCLCVCVGARVWVCA